MSRRDRSMPAGFVVLIGAAMLVAPGCATYKITIKCGEMINKGSLSPGASEGGTLRMAIVCLTEENLESIKDYPTFQGLDVEKPKDTLNSKAWFDGELQSAVKEILSLGDQAASLDELTVTANASEPLQRKVSHPKPSGKHSWIWVFAEFHEVKGEGKKVALRNRLAKRTRWLFGRHLTIKVGPTSINWVE